ncbi:hypothetical protein ruthe_02696 [Rubellimicrobium thermophilum DSM 16684]|uniref:Glycosyltransferase family 92 protein n=1 Tax=Rubellimicrobium thermophilum DSM 16684 TaxID=1123069 RepID=S9QUU1_9RHOB|nr:hypothetical protein [Rubellimicrobium thermophilum]EPX83403.1 hypothetical protein ruthe_02696 [Rubellimicrobium thermophilum DSM 16684]
MRNGGTPPRPAQPPKTSAYRAIRGHPALAWAEWMFICDVDEFLLPLRGDGTLAGFLADVPAEVLGICVHWLCFGNGGARFWKDGLTHRRFVTRGLPGRRINVFSRHSSAIRPAGGICRTMPPTASTRPMPAAGPRRAPAPWWTGPCAPSPDS